jgi:hypothetical protein
MTRLLAAVASACQRLSRPPRRPLKQCTCGTWNEPDNTTCLGCLQRF